MFIFLCILSDYLRWLWGDYFTFTQILSHQNFKWLECDFKMKSAFVQRYTASNTPASLMGRARFDSFWRSPWISTTVSTQLEFHFGKKEQDIAALLLFIALFTAMLLKIRVMFLSLWHSSRQLHH